MEIRGISWHAVVTDDNAFDAARTFFTQLLGAGPSWEAAGFSAFHTADGASLELVAPQHVPDHGLNEGVAFGFLVDDIDVASAAVESAGGTLVGDVVRTEAVTYRHFQSPDGRVFGLTEAR